MVPDGREKAEKTSFLKQALSLIKNFLNWIDSGQKQKPVCKT